MSLAGLSNALKGPGGEFEVNRVVGAFGGFAYVVTACGLVAWEVLVKGREFDIVAFCAAFPAGLGVAIAAVAGAVAWKDKGVASAKIISETGAVPAAPPLGPPVPTDDVTPRQPVPGEYPRET